MTKKNIRIGIVVVLLVLLITLLVQNSGAVTISFLSMHLQMPLFAVVLLSVLLGWVMGKLIRNRK